jgi:hypothetical protein
MPRRTIGLIRERILLGKYDMTIHALEEMAEDNLDILDVEHAILTGRISKTEKTDPRGTIYVVEGVGVDALTTVAVVGRFTTSDRYLIITVYGKEDFNGKRRLRLRM